MKSIVASTFVPSTSKSRARGLPATSAAVSVLLAALVMSPLQSARAQPDQDPQEQRPAQHATEPLSDAQILAAIEEEYRADVSVPFNTIDVIVNDGVVTLNGDVTDVGAKLHAVSIAESVRSVRSVVDRLTIAARRVAPYELSQSVIMALALDPATDAYEIDVSADRDGRVTLRGEVDSWTERVLAERVAMTVNGVREVVNDLQIVHGGARPDIEIADEIRGRMRFDTLLDDAEIDVEVQEGAVKLTGTVGSAAEKRHARTISWIGGVQTVDDGGLEVSRKQNDSRQRDTRYTVLPDAQVRGAIQDALLYDPRTSGASIRVEVAGGFVALRGNVDNLKAKLAAEQDARNTVGVAGVANYIRVRPTRRFSDEQIERNLREALALNATVEAYEITVDVENGIARLEGTVDTSLEHAEARDVAARTAGVQEVRDRISVRMGRPFVHDPFFYGWYPGGYSATSDEQKLYSGGTYHRPDAQIERDIESQFLWSPFVDGDRIEVSVDAGVATLRGPVHSWHERRMARENAYEGGAIAVRDRMQLARGEER